MKLIEFNRNPGKRQLRQFSALCVIMLPAIVWLWSGSPRAILYAAIIGLVTGAAGLIRPALIRPLFLLLMAAAFPLGLVMGELVIGFIYFGVFMPIALIFRLSGRDALRRKMDRRAESYWTARHQPQNAGSYFRQFTVSQDDPN